MPRSRRGLSAPLKEFTGEIDRLYRLDAENQRDLVPRGVGRTRRGRLSRRQLYLLTEGLFFAAFRAYENYLRDVFLLYCMEKQPASGGVVRSYLRPRSFFHAELLVKSSMRFLDWANPDDVVKRAELYLADGFPIKEQYAARMEIFRDMRRLRNHIAHNSPESVAAYRVAIRKQYGVDPVPLPTPGEFLLRTNKDDPSRYMLITYFDFLRSTAGALV